MLASLNGKLILKDNNYAVVECGGVGFKCLITKNTFYNIGSVGDNVFLHTYLAVREDALDLFGFYTADFGNSLGRCTHCTEYTSYWFYHVIEENA